MKLRFAFFLAVLCIFPTVHALAKVGDTTHVDVIDNYLWTYNGQQDRWAVFPPAGTRYERVLMRYKLTCPSPSCGQWDYIARVLLLQHTGIIDSTLKSAPNFTIGSNTVDSIRISYDTLHTYSYNAKTKATDSSAEAPVKIFFYRNPANPFLATDSMFAWQAGYWNHHYDSTGKAIDSFYVAGDTELVVKTVQAYDHYEVVNSIELGRFITPYGGWFPKDWNYTWTFDVTPYASLLHDSVEIRSVYGGYTQGSLYSLAFDCIEGTPPADAYNVQVVTDGDFPYGNPGNPISNYFPPWRLGIDSTADLTTLRLITTGHGEDSTNSDEFADHTNQIWINGKLAYSQNLWRSNCGQNPVWAQAGTWYYQRAGWCPGDKVNYWDYDLTPFGNKGDSITVQYKPDPYTSPGRTGANIFTQIQQISFHGPNFQNDVRMDGVLQPNNAPEFNRMNPICGDGSPLVLIRNTGKNDLKSATIFYGHDGDYSNSYTWTGDLKFMDTATVSLPPINLGDSGTHTFTAIAELPNGVPDEYPRGDTITTQYLLPKHFSNTFIITLKTDKIGYGLSNGINFQITDVNGNYVVGDGGFNDNTLHRDTVNLPNGCYQFAITDDNGIGLYPIFPSSIAGYYSIVDDKKQTVINANAANHLASFGNQQITTFNAGGIASSVNEFVPPTPFHLSVLPNPASTTLSVDLSPLAGISTPATLQIFDVLGHAMITKVVHPGNFGMITIPVASLPNGDYIVLVRSFGKRNSKEIAIQH